jgi:hypothetical protein
MGHDWRPNQAMSIPLLLRVLEEIEYQIEAAMSWREENRWTVFHTYAAVCYVVLLRGPEGLMLDLSGLKQKLGAGGNEYVTIALLGKIKGETDNRAHLLSLVPVTLSCVDVAGSLKCLIDLKECSGLISGPAISDFSGRIYEPSDMNNALLEYWKISSTTTESFFLPW